MNQSATGFFKDYGWQEEAKDAFFDNLDLHWAEEKGRFQEAFVAEVSPSGGKTKFSLKLSRDMINAGLIDKVFWIVPRTSIKDGIERDAEDVEINEEYRRMGSKSIRVDTELVPNCTRIMKNYHGAVVTYQALSSFLDLFRLLAKSMRLLFIFDEIHHGHTASEDDPCGNKWGEAITQVRDIANAVVCMTGTPVRTDQGRVPFFRYDEETVTDPLTGEIHTGWRVRASYKFTYADAIDAGVARKLIFRRHNPMLAFRYTKDGVEQEFRGELASVPKNLVDYAKRQLLSPERGHIDEMLKVAWQENQDRRSVKGLLADPKAAILVVVGSTDEGNFNPLKYVEKRIYQLFKEKAVAVESKDGVEASDAIKNFKDLDCRWIVAKDMISEGTNIPRVRVIVILRDIKSEVRFQQTVHRATRNASEYASQDALVILYRLPEMTKFSRAIEEDVRLVIPKPHPECPSCHAAVETRPRSGYPCPLCGYEPESGKKTGSREFEWLESEFGLEDVVQGGKDFSRHDPIARVIFNKLGQTGSSWLGGRHGINEVLKLADEITEMGDPEEPPLFTIEEQCKNRWKRGLDCIKRAAGLWAQKNSSSFQDAVRDMTASCKRIAGMAGLTFETVLRDKENPLEIIKLFEGAAQRLLDRETSSDSRRSA